VSLVDALEGADVVFVGTAHQMYIYELNASMLAKHRVRFVLDGRNALDKSAIEAAGISYRGIGR
jgi:hypothetical protein